MHRILLDLKYHFLINAFGTLAWLADIYYNLKNKVPRCVRDKQPLQDFHCVITGGGRGIGADIARDLARRRAHIILGVRQPSSCEALLQELRTLGASEAVAEQLDTSSLKSVAGFAECVKKRYPKLQLLVNNAGILYVPRTLSVDGIELQFATNHLGHFLLTHLLISSLERAEESRVVHVSSCTHFPGPVMFDDINLEKYYNKTHAYSQSKMAQLMFSFYLDTWLLERTSRIRSVAVHPGVVSTGMGDVLANHLAIPFLPRLLKSSEKGAATVIFGCLAPDVGGLYLSNYVNGSVFPPVRKPELQQKLFELSCRLAGIKRFGDENDLPHASA